MGRGRRFTSHEAYEKALREGIGVGSAEFYQPWLRPQDFTRSKGIRSAIKGLKTSRQHNMLSGIETDFFYLAEFNDAVIDIREQFPLLPLALTKNIARILNVSHPALRRKSGDTESPTIAAVMTTDFVLTLRNPDGSIKYQAYSVKPDEKISKRNAEKQEIERLFWEGINVRFQVYTGNETTRIKSKNICWITSPFRNNGLPDIELDYGLQGLFPPGKYALNHMVRKIALAANIEDDAALETLKFMIATKCIVVDLTYNIASTQVVSVLSSTLFTQEKANECY